MFNNALLAALLVGAVGNGQPIKKDVQKPKEAQVKSIKQDVKKNKDSEKFVVQNKDKKV